MRLQEVQSYYSVGDELIFEYYEILKEKTLVENSTNYKEYTDFINREKVHTISHQSLIPNNVYYPLGLQSVPVGQIALIKYSSSIQKYLNTQSGKMYFNTPKGIVDYPLTRNLGDGILETLVYDKFNDLTNFLMLFKLNFSNWDIRITTL